jgi:hypothetical protein
MTNTTASEPAAPATTSTHYTPENRAIAEEILRQLGGGRFKVMTGSKDFTVIKNGLRFKVGSNSKRVNAMEIVLDADDTYTVRAMWVQMSRKTFQVTTTMRDEMSGVYNDMLQDVFTRMTGMYTHL